MTQTQKIEFTVKIEDKDEEFAVRRPTIIENNEAQAEYTKTFFKALNNKAVLRAKMNEYLVEQGLWSDKKQVELNEISAKIATLEKELHDGGKISKFYKLEDGKPTGAILELRKLRNDQLKLQSILIEGTDMTAEGQARNAQFNYLLSQCLVYNKSGLKYWKSYDEFVKQPMTPVAQEAFKHFTNLMYELDTNYSQKLPENKFLKNFGFCDDKYRLVNSDGHLIDEDGRLIDENGNWVNAEGQIVDINGTPRTKDGDYLDEQKPFTDDDGNVITPKSEEKKESAG